MSTFRNRFLVSVSAYFGVKKKVLKYENDMVRDPKKANV